MSKKNTKDSDTLGQSASVRTATKTRESQNYSRFSTILPDIGGLTQRILESDLDHTKALAVESKVDDQIAWAPNVLTWAIDKRFNGMVPFAKQLETLINLYEDACPYCSDREYVANIPTHDTLHTITSKIAMLEFGRCPYCRKSRAEARADGFFHDPGEALMVWGQRSGKTVTAALAGSYLVHKTMQYGTPWQTFGLSPGQVLDFTIVATKVAQAADSLWATLAGQVEASPWFKQYKKLCDEEGQKHGVKEVIKYGETFMWFDHKRIQMQFGSNDHRGLRGSTRFGAGIEELSHFGSGDGESKDGIRSNGAETFTVLNNSLLTVRSAVTRKIAADPACDLVYPKMLCLSSPLAMNDPLMTLYRDHAGDNKAVRRHYSTEEVNSTLSKDEIDRMMRLPNGSRDFGAIPPLADDPLISRTHIITDAFKHPLATDLRYGPLIVPVLHGMIDDLDQRAGSSTIHYTTAAIDRSQPMPPAPLALSEADLVDLGPFRAFYEGILRNPPARRNRVLGIDLGQVTNACALVAGYLEDGVFVTDFALEIKPTGSRPLNLADIYENLICPLVTALNVVCVVYDRWQSLHQIQDLANRFGALGPKNNGMERKAWLKKIHDKGGLPPFLAMQYSLTVSDANLLISRLEQQDILFPQTEMSIMDLQGNKQLDPSEYPYAHLALQLATVRSRKNRLLKPTNGDDDLFRAWANAAVKAFTDDLVVQMLGAHGTKQDKPAVNQSRGYAVRASGHGGGLRRGAGETSGTATTSSVGTMAAIRRTGKMRG